MSVLGECSKGKVVKAKGRCLCTPPLCIRHWGEREGGSRQLMAGWSSQAESASGKEESDDNKVALASINLPHTAGLSG